VLSTSKFLWLRVGENTIFVSQFVVQDDQSAITNAGRKASHLIISSKYYFVREMKTSGSSVHG
jgi:hypothetical protein